MVIAVIVAIALASVGILLVLVIGLARHMKLLAGSLVRFQKEMQPLLEEIQSGSLTAQQRVQVLSERRRHDRAAPASSEDPGAKLRS